MGPAHEPAIVTLEDDFPFAAPKVVLPQRRAQADWHQTMDGSLCLWDNHSKGDQPWLDGAGLVARVEEWIVRADAGWVDDAPQLDLEAYNRPRLIVQNGHRLHPFLVIEEWDQIAGHWFTANAPNATGVISVRAAQLPLPHAPPRTRSANRKRGRKRKARRTERFLNGVAVDLGEMTAPLVSTDELIAALDANRPRVVGLLDTGRPALVVARYTRSAVQGLIGFWLELEGDGLDRRCFAVAERGPAQQRRAGWHASIIKDRKVSVIGAGSVGSYVVDMLHRSGVRDLRVHDWDVLLPGNLVRHAASPTSLGAPKTAAIRDTAALRDPTSRIEAAGAVAGLDAAMRLLRERDLVLDCTGDRLTWQLMRAAADIVSVPFLHVAVVGHGQFGRVDVHPPLGGCAPLTEDEVDALPATGWEGGCGDPISPTPPAAVIETAAMGARFAIRMLAGEDVAPAGESRELLGIQRTTQQWLYP